MKAWEESLSTARYLISTHDGRVPPVEHLKSAIGDAYYTVFHRLQSMCADCFIGDEDDPNTPDKAWLEAYRSLTHGVIYSACVHTDVHVFPQNMQSVADSVVMLSNARRSIDYHPRTNVDLEVAQACLRLAEHCLDMISECPKRDRIAFSAWIAFERKGGVADARSRARSSDPDALDPRSNSRNRSRKQ